MQAIVYAEYGPPDVVRVDEVAMPAPQDDEVLIRIRAATVTTTDCAFRRGDPLIRLFFGLRKPKRPILGTELAGEIAAVGKKVRQFREGDQVFAATGAEFGGHAEFICVPEDGALASKPANATFAEAAGICEGGLTALPFLRDKGQIQQDQRVLINGAAGAVGSAAVRLARYFGADVTGVCGLANVELVTSLGAPTVIDYTQQDFTRSRQTYDIIFDAVGKSSFARCRGALAPGGVYLGTVPSWGLYTSMLRTARSGGKRAKVAAIGLRPARERAADLLFLKDLTEAGELKPVIDGLYPLDQAAAAHTRVETGHKRGHVVLTAS